MSGINSVKNYKYFILVKKKIEVLKRLKQRREKVCWHQQLYILLKELGKVLSCNSFSKIL